MKQLGSKYSFRIIILLLIISFGMVGCLGGFRLYTIAGRVTDTMGDPGPMAGTWFITVLYNVPLCL